MRKKYNLIGFFLLGILVFNLGLGLAAASDDDDDGILALAEEEPLKFADDELLDLDEGLDLEADDEIIPLDGFNNLEAEDGEKIIEITEFDEHFPAEGEALLKQSGILDASGEDEEDFLEHLSAPLYGC